GFLTADAGGDAETREPAHARRTNAGAVLVNVEYGPTCETVLRAPARDRVGAAEVADLARDLVQALVLAVTRGGDRLVHPGRDLGHVGLGHAASGDRGGADAQPRRVEGLARVVRDGVEVQLDPGP